jgi:hypothetical protein
VEWSWPTVCIGSNEALSANNMYIGSVLVVGGEEGSNGAPVPSIEVSGFASSKLISYH